MYLFFDTETTGLPRDWRAPLEDLDNWPRLVQLAWILSDEKGNELQSQNLIVKPNGFIIPEAASNVHGISTQRALEEGVDLDLALGEFSQALKNSKILVAHNMNYDEMIMGAEFLRMNYENDFIKTSKICTMQSSVDFCKIPTPRGYKWPRLTELHQILFNSDFEGAHDALADVKACNRCFFELQKRGVIQ